MGLTTNQRRQKAAASRACAARAEKQHESRNLDSNTRLLATPSKGNSTLVIIESPGSGNSTTRTRAATAGDVPFDDSGVSRWNGRVDWDSDEDGSLSLEQRDDSDTEGSGLEINELEADELVMNLERMAVRHDQQLAITATHHQSNSAAGTLVAGTSLNEKLSGAKISTAQWRRAEMNRGLGYNGNSARTKRRAKQQAAAKEKKDEETRNTYVLSLL